MAISQKMAAARFNTAEHTIFDNHVICLAGDGCMQEGIAHGGERVCRRISSWIT